MKKLSLKETLFVASMLFGMFFGAGNLIFPASMGQLSGSHLWTASIGFLITGVGLPLLGVAALGISRKEGLLELSAGVGRKYGLFFTLALYLTIGPFFAIPRCATVSYTVGIQRILPEADQTLVLAVFFPGIFRGGPVLFPAARTDPDLDREDPEPSVPVPAGHSGDPGAHKPYGESHGPCACRRL